MAPQGRPSHAIRVAPDPVRDTIAQLAHRLPDDTDTKVVLDFLEDDLREGLSAIADVEAHFEDVLEVLRSDESTVDELLAAAAELEVVNHLEALLTLAIQVRRRVQQAAGRLTISAIPPGSRRGRPSRQGG